MIAIHPVHRRLAEIILKTEKVGGFHMLPVYEQSEIFHCLQVNAKLVYDLDSLKELSLHAYEINDMEWLHDLTKRIDDLESKCL